MPKTPKHRERKIGTTYGKGFKVLDINIEGFTVLGLSRIERKIIIATWKMAKEMSIIALHADIPRGSVVYAVKNLEKRKLLKKRPSIGASMCWRANLPEAIRTLIHTFLTR
jgi:DNA-binding MarR family transcriptional regulator